MKGKQAHCFHRALRSVQNQSLKNIEIIIIDDCSSDDSIRVIEKYMEEDRRISIINKLFYYYYRLILLLFKENIFLDYFIFLKHENNDG